MIVSFVARVSLGSFGSKQFERRSSGQMEGIRPCLVLQSLSISLEDQVVLWDGP